MSRSVPSFMLQEVSSFQGYSYTRRSKSHFTSSV